MNKFEKEVQAKTNDVIDSGLGFVYSFLFFTIIFFSAVIIKAVAL